MLHELPPVLVLDLNHSGLEAVMTSSDAHTLCRGLESLSKVTKLVKNKNLLSRVSLLGEHRQNNCATFLVILDRDKKRFLLGGLLPASIEFHDEQPKLLQSERELEKFYVLEVVVF